MFNCEVNRTMMYFLSVSDGSVPSIATKICIRVLKEDTFFFLSCQIINLIKTL